MLIMDHGKQPDLGELTTRNIGYKKDQVRDIQNAGLSPIVSEGFNLKALKLLLQQNGPAIIPIDDKELGGHVIVVDEITDEGVRLRDPYHGWEITVTLEAFNKRFGSEYAIQIKAPATLSY